MPATVVQLLCSSNGVTGYQVMYSNGSKLSFILGVNATSLPPSFAPVYIIVDYFLVIAAIGLMLSTIYVIASSSLSRRMAAVLIIINLIVTAGAGVYSSSPLRPLNVSCGSSSFTIFITDPALPLAYMAFIIELVNMLIFFIVVFMKYQGLL